MVTQLLDLSEWPDDPPIVKTGRVAVDIRYYEYLARKIDIPIDIDGRSRVHPDCFVVRRRHGRTSKHNQNAKDQNELVTTHS
jgi:hypothetical protein